MRSCLGVLGLVMFLWQGAAWLALKSENALYDRAVKTRSLMAWVFVALVVVATAATFLLVPRAASQVMASPAGWAVPRAAARVDRLGPARRERQGSHGVVRGVSRACGAHRTMGRRDLPSARSGDQRRRAVVDHRELGLIRSSRSPS